MACARHQRFPSDRRGLSSAELAMKVSASVCTITIAAWRRPVLRRELYWLAPLETTRRSPYLVGIYSLIAVGTSALYLSGISHLQKKILDIPPSLPGRLCSHHGGVSQAGILRPSGLILLSGRLSAFRETPAAGESDSDLPNHRHDVQCWLSGLFER